MDCHPGVELVAFVPFLAVVVLLFVRARPFSAVPVASVCLVESLLYVYNFPVSPLISYAGRR